MARAWRRRDLVALNADVYRCFGSVPHWAFADALARSEMPSLPQLALVREYGGLIGQARLRDAGVGAPLPFHKGGRTVAVETPALLNLFRDVNLERVVAAWERDGVGFQLETHVDEATGELFHHPIWADNFFMLATSLAALERMLGDLARVLGHLELCWKPGSLEVMWSRLYGGEDRGPVWVPQPDRTKVRAKEVQALRVLGDMVSDDGGSLGALDVREVAANRAFYLHVRQLQDCRVALAHRLRAWTRASRPAFVYGNETWHWTLSMLRHVNR